MLYSVNERTTFDAGGTLQMICVSDRVKNVIDNGNDIIRVSLTASDSEGVTL